MSWDSPKSSNEKHAEEDSPAKTDGPNKDLGLNLDLLDSMRAIQMEEEGFNFFFDDSSEYAEQPNNLEREGLFYIYSI